MCLAELYAARSEATTAHAEKHVLAAFDALNKRVMYLSASRSWTAEAQEALCFPSLAEANAYLHAAAPPPHPSLVWPHPIVLGATADAGDDAAQSAGQAQEVLLTGIYG